MKPPEEIPLEDLNMESQQDQDGEPLLGEQPEQLPKRSFLSLLWNGPVNPIDEPAPRIKWLERWEKIPDRLDRVSHPVKVVALISYLLLWFGVVYQVLVPYFVDAPGQGTVVSLACGSAPGWRGKNAACGMDGGLCASAPGLDPSAGDSDDIVVRCPALCDRGAWVYSLMPMGDQRIKYRGYFVGGGHDGSSDISQPYRADSFACGAGVHAGVVSPFFGGCARLTRSGAQTKFDLAPGRGGLGPSIGFSSFFPFSYTVAPAHASRCYDPRLAVLVLNIVLGAPVVFLASGAVVFWTINTVGFWTICLATDPPVSVDALDPETYANLLSTGLERFLPLCFILYVLWHVSVRRTFSTPPDAKRSPLTALFLWYPLFWLGVLNNITFDRLPVDRLTLNDLRLQPGAILAVGSIATTIIMCAFIQGYKIWLSGRFQKYLGIYLLFVFGLVVVSNFPGLTLRVHHYILAMLLIPGCSTRGRTAWMFQGILLGLFLSGAARWGLAAIAETDTSLRRDDPVGAILPPAFIGFNKNTFDISLSADFSDQYTSVSLLINDIERYVGDKIDLINIKLVIEAASDLKQLVADSLKNNKNIPIYLRLGKKIPGTHMYSDFTNAAVLEWPSGKFKLPKPGVT